MNTEKYRKYIVALFIVGMIMISLSYIGFWNVYTNSKVSLGFTTILFCILSFSSLTMLFIVALKALNVEEIDNYISDKVAENRKGFIAEMSKEDKQEESLDELDLDQLNKVRNLIPSENLKKIEQFSKKLLSNIANEFNLVQGMIFQHSNQSKNYTFVAGYGLTNKDPIEEVVGGEGLTGEAAKGQKVVVINDIPENYFTIASGLGTGQPCNIIILPIVHEEKTIAIIELASFSAFNEKNVKLMENFSDIVSKNFKQLIKA